MLTLSILASIETPNLILREFEAQDCADLASFMTQARYQRYIAHKLKDDDAVADFVRRQVPCRAMPIAAYFIWPPKNAFRQKLLVMVF